MMPRTPSRRAQETLGRQQPDLSKVLGEFPDISDDSLFLPKWIEAALKRTIKHNGRPVLAWDIAASERTRVSGCGARVAGFACTGPTTRRTR
jgi:hypothetical protein